MHISHKYSSEVIKRHNTKISRSETNDCVVRAIATAFDITYNQSHKFCSDTYERKNRKGVLCRIYHSVNKKFSDGQVELFGKTMTQVGDKCKYTGNIKPFTYYKKKYWDGTPYTKQCKMTVGTFLKKYPRGTFILSVNGHTFTVKDGTVIGNWSDLRKARVRVDRAWEIKNV